MIFFDLFTTSFYDPTMNDLTIPPELMRISDEACRYVKDHKKEIVEKFAGSDFPVVTNPMSVFMAGSPGAGKTEFSKSLIKILVDSGICSDAREIVRIDGDEVRVVLPSYTGSNSGYFQGAISLAVEKIHDFVIHKSKNFILDGTFSNEGKQRDNIIRSIRYGRRILIVYVYQDPFVAWKFTQKREMLEGRRITKDVFVREYFSAMKTVQRIKDEFGEGVDVWFVEKDLDQKLEKVRINVDRIDTYIKIKYTEERLRNELSESYV
jgi:hypothetical protein